jgi:RNA polymerase sigma-70 factor (ECF subfamily)
MEMNTYVLETGNEKALTSQNFEARAGETRKRVYGLALRMLGNRCDAEDVTQETLVRAWAGFASYDSARSFDAWILRIATNLCIDRIRRRQRRTEVSLEAYFNVDADGEGGGMEVADLSQNPERLLMAREIDGPLQQGLRDLPALHRRCVQLIQSGYSYEEIAGLMQCPLGTVRSRVHRARAHLRHLMAR